MQETARAIAERSVPTPSRTFRRFLYVALIRQMDHQLGRRAAIPAADIAVPSHRGQDRTTSTTLFPASVHDEVCVPLLAEAVLEHFEREHARDTLMALVSCALMITGANGRHSLGGPGGFRAAPGRLCAAADWNAILKTA
jgi:hypothetical protein